VISKHYVEEASKASTIEKQILVDQEPEKDLLKIIDAKTQKR
jgi:hypothetical protein